MFKRLGVFGLMLAAAGTMLVQPATAFGQDRYDRGNGYAYYGRDDHRGYRGDGGRDFRGHQWREREERARAWREQEWRERQRWENREYRYNNYAPGYSDNPYYARPY